MRTTSTACFTAREGSVSLPLLVRSGSVADNSHVSQENVEIVRAGYEGFARGDLEPWIASFHPDVTLDLSRRQIDQAIFRGREGVRAFLQAQRDAWSNQRIEPEEYIDIGDSVVVPIRFVSTGRA